MFWSEGGEKEERDFLYEARVSRRWTSLEGRSSKKHRLAFGGGGKQKSGKACSAEEPYTKSAPRGSEGRDRIDEREKESCADCAARI